MISNFKTGRLPQNFIFLGVLLLAVSIWRIWLLDWIGGVFLVISCLCLFIKSGLLIDTDNKRLKRYIGIFTIRLGEWENISPIADLQIIQVKKMQRMHVLTINRLETKDVFKLILVWPDKKIELIAGEEDYINENSKFISLLLKTPVLNK